MCGGGGCGGCGLCSGVGFSFGIVSGGVGGICMAGVELFVGDDKSLLFADEDEPLWWCRAPIDAITVSGGLLEFLDLSIFEFG